MSGQDGSGPLSRYRRLVKEGVLQDDPAQLRAVEKLQILHNRLQDYDPVQPKRVGIGLFGWGRERIRQDVVPGLYLFGGVGRGKSMLMDLFFADAPPPHKRRVHFHAFMQEVHAGIARARVAGAKDPIADVAQAVSASATLLCFDELQVTDITDAMIVGRLFEALFARGVVVVTTSNRPPDDLYKDGLNRDLFLPFIALIKQKLDLHELASARDHRLGRAQGVRVWFSPLDADSAADMDAVWAKLAGGVGAPFVLEVGGRAITLPQRWGRVARVGFAALCEMPLGAADYLRLTQEIDWLLLEGIPVLSRARFDAAKRFVTLIDTLYEARVRLVAAAEAEPETLYASGAGSFEFQRTVSRLREMQAASWTGDALG
ncbi:MAG: cell division protein ZapE [Pseudomonadota bacterium]